MIPGGPGTVATCGSAATPGRATRPCLRSPRCRRPSPTPTAQASGSSTPTSSTSRSTGRRASRWSPTSRPAAVPGASNASWRPSSRSTTASPSAHPGRWRSRGRLGRPGRPPGRQPRRFRARDHDHLRGVGQGPRRVGGPRRAGRGAVRGSRLRAAPAHRWPAAAHRGDAAGRAADGRVPRLHPAPAAPGPGRGGALRGLRRRRPARDAPGPLPGQRHGPPGPAGPGVRTRDEPLRLHGGLRRARERQELLRQAAGARHHRARRAGGGAGPHACRRVCAVRRGGPRLGRGDDPGRGRPGVPGSAARLRRRRAPPHRGGLPHAADAYGARGRPGRAPGGRRARGCGGRARPRRGRRCG